MDVDLRSTADELFNSQLRQEFDFNLPFSQTILSILPSSWFIAATPVYASYLSHDYYAPWCPRLGHVQETARVRVISSKRVCSRGPDKPPY